MLNDLRYALRLIRRSPGYSLVVIGVLGLGIAVNVVAFAMVKALALSPLPGVDPADLQVVVARTKGGDLVPLSYPDFRRMREQNVSYSGLAGSGLQIYMLGRGRDVRQVFGELVTGNYFHVLGVSAQLGRTLVPSDEQSAGRNPVVVLADSFWRIHFDADPGIVGRTIFLNGEPLTVVGVAASGFRGSVVGLSNDLFLPVTMQPLVSGCRCNSLDEAASPMLFGFGRPRPGVTLAQARADAALVGRRLAADRPIDTMEARAVVVRLWDSPYGAQTYVLPAVTLTSAMALLLLGVVCANIAGLVLARNLTRRGEIAARLSVGASRWRLVRQLFVENLALAVPGAVLGTQLPYLAETFLRSPMNNVSLPLYFAVEPDWISTMFAAALACAASVVYGLIPGLGASRLDLASMTREGAAPLTRRSGWMRTGLVTSQIATAVLLLVSTALIARSLDAARTVDTGFDSDIATATFHMQAAGYDEARGRVFQRDLVERVRKMGAEASVAMYLPLTFIETDTLKAHVEEYTPRPGEDVRFMYNVITPGYFRTLGRSVVAGRDFDDRDEGSTPVVIVNETLATRYWGSAAAALGRQVRVDYWRPESQPWRTIVGVAPDMKYARVTEAPRPYLYVPMSQNYSAFATLHVRRAPGAPHPTLDDLRRLIAEMDANMPVVRAAMLTEQLAMSVAVFDFTARALSIIGIAAAGLAALGVYGLIAFAVRQRAQEIGIRMAIGASPRRILQTFLGQGLRLGTIGAAAGIVAAFAAARLMSALLFGVDAADAVSFAAASAAVFVVVLTASLVPAWAASRTNPLTAIRKL